MSQKKNADSDFLLPTPMNSPSHPESLLKAQLFCTKHIYFGAG